jgi:hypothetical protein
MDQGSFENRKIRRRKFGAFLGGGKGTLALRSRLVCCFARLGSRVRRQLPDRSGDVLVIEFAVLHGHTRPDDQITEPLRLKVDRERYWLCLAANLFGDDHLVRFDRSDRALGEMGRRLGCFRLGRGGWVWIPFGAFLTCRNHRAQHKSCGTDQSESLEF